MSIYTDPELLTDERTVAEEFLAAFADRINAALNLTGVEEWVANEGSPETVIGEAVGIVLATAMATVMEEERNDYASFGELILDTPRKVAEPAEATSRWTFSLSAAHFIPDGSELVLDAPDGTPVVFATVGDVNLVGTVADIPVAALEPGSIGNSLVGAARDYEPLPHLSGVELITTSSGGSDGEERDEYLERVGRRARRMKLVPIVTDDYADTALDHPSVGSAVAVRLLDADNPTDPPSSAGHVTVYVRDAAGNDLSAADMEAVRLSFMGDDRPLAVTTHVRAPTRTDMSIQVSIRLTTGADEPATVAEVQGAVAAAYSAATYGIDEDAPGRWRAPRTAAERTINEYDVTAVIDDLPGVAKIEAVTLTPDGGAPVDAVTMAGWAPLPNLLEPAARLTTALTGTNNDLTFTADARGTSGNAIRVAYVAPAAASTPLSVAVAGNDVTVTLASDAANAITSTAAQVRDAVNANAAAAALVTAANAPGNDGTGVVTAMSLTSLTGGADAVAVTVVT